MTQAKNNRLALFVVSFMALAAAVVLLFCSPSTSYAATLGSEEPYVYFEYKKDGKAVDGNQLNTGTYDVNIWVKGVEAISTLQVTANLDSTVTCAPQPSALMSDEIADVVSMGYVINDSDIVFGFVSDNAECSQINKEATLVAGLSMTFAQAGDAADHITVSTNPNLTFVQTNYNDGYDDSYALVQEFEGYAGTLYPMTSDVSPVVDVPSAHSVSGSIVIMTNGNGDTAGNAVSGEYTVDVYSDEARTQLLKTVKSTEKVDENNLKTNAFVIDGLEDGTYYLAISSQYAITRSDITLIVNGADIAADPIPIIACDYTEDGGITATDALTVYTMSANTQADYCDLNRDGGVTSTDALIVSSCATGMSYKSITISNKG